MKKNSKLGKVSMVTPIGIILASALVLGIAGYVGSKDNSDPIPVEKSLVAKQSVVEKQFDTSGHTLENPEIILNPYGNSPLTALVLFETEEEGVPLIEVKGKDELSTIKGSGEKGTKHYLPIYGLYPDKENKVIIDFNGEKKELTIKTEKLDEKVVLPKEVFADKENLSNDLYFFTPSSDGLPSAYDVNGDVRWYLTEKLTWGISRLENGRLLVSTERLINSPYYNTGMYEIDLLGKIYTEFSMPGGYHHDYVELENGNLLVASDDFSDFLQGTVEDLIVELDRETGEVVKEWDLKEVLPKRDGKSENWTEYDWFHNNSVWYDKATNSIVLSGRHQDAVVSIDYDTSKLNWIIGDPTNWSEEYQKYFFTPVGADFEWQWSQHSAKVTPEGYISILDNGNNKSKIKEEYVAAEDSYTRGVIYKIDTDKMEIEQIYQYGKERGSDFYSPYISDFDIYSNNHMLIHSGGIVSVDGKPSNSPAGFDDNPELTSTTVELLNDEVVFELTLPTNMYRAEKMPLYVEEHKFELREGVRLGTLGETKASRVNELTLEQALSPNEDYKAHNIVFKNEEDRIAMHGVFDKGRIVTLVLAKDGEIKEYDIPVSVRPYTALCINIFTTEETEKTLELYKYINKDGLDGEYEIYLEIDDVLYNTGEKAEM